MGKGRRTDVHRCLPVVLLVFALLAACADGEQTAPNDALGMIRGSVLLGPTCPVESLSSPCPYQPLPDVTVRAIDREGDVATTAVSDEDGRFVMDLSPGSYVLVASVGDGARSVPPTRVTVRAGEVVRTEVLIDSGIR